jgi:sugar phosphate permease
LIKQRKLSDIFFGWWTVLATGIIGFLGVGFVGQGFSVLFKPIAAELNLNRAVTSIASSVQVLDRGIMSPLGGWLSDKYGPRVIMLFGISCLVLGCIMMYFVNSLWSYLIVWGILIGTGHTLGCTIITDKAIVNWFVKKSGIALNTKFAIQSLSGILLLPVIAWLVENKGWQETCVIAGIAIAVVSLPLTWFFVKKHRPEHYGLLPDGAKTIENTNGEIHDIQNNEEVEFTFRQTMKTPSYWMIITIGVIFNLAAPIMNVHCIPFLTDLDIDPVKAARMMAIILTAGIPARLIGGYFVDRVKKGQLRFIIAFGYMLQAIGILTYLVSRSVDMIYVWFLLFGFGQGISQSVQLPLYARYFGRKAYGSILGSTMAMSVPTGLIAPVYTGWVYDTTGSYIDVFTLFAVLLGIAGFVSFLIIPPKPPAQNTDLSKIF